MKALRKFILSMVIGGFGVVLPLIVLVFFFKWLKDVIANAIRPFAGQLTNWFSISHTTAAWIAIGIVVLVCFLIGLIIRTRVGTFVHTKLEKIVLQRIPGYKLIRDSIKPFLNRDGRAIFDKPALIRPYGNGTMMTCFITDVSEKTGTCTAFVPTSPNPTNGLVFHVKQEDVTYLDASFEDVMKTIVVGGAGTSQLINS